LPSLKERLRVRESQIKKEIGLRQAKIQKLD
jgi:hypothetical protein